MDGAMKRWIVLFGIISLLLFVAPKPFARTYAINHVPNAGAATPQSPDAHFGTEDGPDTKIVMTPGKNPGQSIPIDSRTVQIFAGTGLINIIPIYNFFARIYYNQNQHRFDDLRELGMTVEHAMKYPLLPYVKQKEYRPPYWGEKLPTNQAPWDTGYRFCAPDGKIARSDGTDKDNIPLEGLAKSRLFIGEGDPVDDKFYYKALTGLRFLTAVNTTSQATLPSTDFFTPTRDIVPIKGTQCLDKDCTQVKYLVEEADLENALYSCGSQSDGTALFPTKTRAAGVAEKGSPGGALGNFIVNIIGEKLIGRRKACNEKDTNDECADTSLYLQPTDSQAGGVWLGCAGNGCTSGELADASSGEIQQLLRDSGADPTNPQSKGGAWNAYWPMALNPLSDKFHGKRDQNEVLNNRSDERKSFPFWTASAVAAFDCVVKGMIMPKSIQDARGYSCYYTESAASKQHGSLDVPKEISTAVSALWPQDTPEGILGIDFLMKQYEGRLNLITTPLTEQERALLMTKIQSLINTYVINGSWPNSGLGNTDYQRQIHDTAAKYGLNEAFLYSLWIEETHASSVGDYPFGCGGYTDFGASLNCIVTDPTVQTYLRDPLPEALCMYADGHRGCTFESHPVFVRNLMYYYDYLTNP
ncbi:hypothetical protein HY339_03550 [Candidatus Gottesmanbacteria bacterium]|nr:hypothetical protein [Candidatus Gottesmanbacteria bacterium]